MRYLSNTTARHSVTRHGNKGVKDTYASSIFIVKGFASANMSNGAGLPGAPSVERPMLLKVLLTLSDGLIFSWRAGLIAAPAIRSGIVTVCTGVTPPNALLLPPQKALAARRGDAVEGRSLWVFGVSNDEDGTFLDAGDGADIDSGLGGGSTGELARPAEARSAFLSALSSCCRTAFSDFVEPSSARIASMSRSRSATSLSSALIYSTRVIQSRVNEKRQENAERHTDPYDGCENCER
jgi:hypothetical protein